MLDVLCHRLKYFLSPQVDLYLNIARAVDARPVRRVLDVGCGTGIGAVLLHRPGRYVRATDVEPTMMAWADEMWGHLIDVHTEPIDMTVATTAPYDLVTCIEVIEHVADPCALLAGLKQAVAPGGLLVISTLNHNSQYRKNNAHVAPFEVASFRRTLTAALGDVLVVDFQLDLPLSDTSGVTPMVGLWRHAD